MVRSINRDDIAAVVIGRNEGKRLSKCLLSVYSQTNFVVYVDSGSTDASAQTAGKLGALVIDLNENKPFTAARGRNAGFQAVKTLRPEAKFVQFIDGDCELADGWVETAMNFVGQRHDVAVVCGRRRERNPTASVYNRLCDIEWNTPIGQTLSCGGDSLVRADAFDDVGGFNEDLIAGEEPELCLRLRAADWEIWRLDAEMTRHDAAISLFSQWWIRSVRCGYGFAEVSILHWNSRFTLWKRELVRAIFWGGLLPGFICVGASLRPIILTALLVYPAQVCRIAVARGPMSFSSWTYATFITLAKFAELQGILRFYWRKLRGHTAKLIEYKRNGNRDSVST